MTKITKTINLFATREDWNNLLEAVEYQLAVDYVQVGSYKESPIRFETYKRLENLGVSSVGNLSREKIYLCIANDAEIKTRKVELRKGSPVKLVDQLSHPDSVVLKTGGKFEDKVIIASQIGTVSDTDWSTSTFSIYQKEVKKQFKKVKSYYVGKDARRLLDEGYRLTANARSPAAYDLSLV